MSRAAGGWRHGWLRWLLAAAGVLMSAGCTDDAPVCVVVAPRPEQGLLVSEAQTASDAGPLIDTAFVLANPGTHPAEIELAGTGCSCYRVLVGDRAMRSGDRMPLAAGGRTTVRFEPRIPAAPQVTHFRAEFHAIPQRGPATSLPLSCTVRTFADVTVRPDVVAVTLGSAPDRPTPVRVVVEQHVRLPHLADLELDWASLPESIDCVPLQGPEPAVEVVAGLWRVRREYELHCAVQNPPASGEPLRLPVVSRSGTKELGRTECVLLIRRAAGVEAPRVVHFGRVPPVESRLRRVQLRALDERPFTVTAIESRGGHATATVAGEQPASTLWVEVSLSASSGVVDDMLVIHTDHPQTPEVSIAIRAVGSAAGGR